MTSSHTHVSAAYEEAKKFWDEVESQPDLDVSQDTEEQSKNVTRLLQSCDLTATSVE